MMSHYSSFVRWVIKDKVIIINNFARQKKARFAAQRQVEEELFFKDSRFNPGPVELSSQKNNDFTRVLQSQIKALHQENPKLQSMVVKDK